ncbi:MAG TPA: SDR family oxidoreductase [Burkholderiales bacterium]|jgi:NAD(P)-dependent dehydrogenase (short-subunit alcohol dehydrogenase family)|nr:SDR family oxidoreductase [Burkholderiales bacterium]
MTPRLLEGDTALVTGAAQGIGKAIAAAIAEEGATVIASDREDCDLSAAGEASRLAQRAIRELGRVSIFVHAACPRRNETDSALEVSESVWREMLEVNLNAGFILAQALGRHMREQSIKGRMLFLTSLHADSPRNLPHYSAAKGGQTMLMKEFARALAPHGIRVNAILPGAVPGGGFKLSPATANLESRIPLGRFGKPEDVAAMAVAVLSERFGRYVAGAEIVVDGGLALYNWMDARA